MAQTLKSHVREDILTSAKQAFLNHGIEQASMRDIAKDAHVTVGNVYRYYQNKEALADAIINPTLKLLNQTIFYQGEGLDDDLTTQSLQHRYAYFESKIHQLSEGFLSVFETHKTECLILLNHDRFYQSLVGWLNELIRSLVDRWVLKKELMPHVDELCAMLSEAIMSGLARGLLDTLVPYHDEPQKLRAIINTYLHLFTLMLEAGEQHEKNSH